MLDPNCTRYKDATVVLPYDVTLNQTDIATNKNKFYTMQVISYGNAEFSLYTRYGRIGEVGVIDYTPGSKSNIVSKFQTTFKSKTKNAWKDQFGTPTASAGNDVSLFTKHPDKYYLCQKQKIDNGSPSTSPSAPVLPVKAVVPSSITPASPVTPSAVTPVSTVAPSTVATVATAPDVTTTAVIKPKLLILPKPKPKLDPRLTQFLQLIGDIKMLNTSMRSLDIDTTKMPLGLLSSEQLDRANDILSEIKSLLSSGTPKGDPKLVAKSSDYYTLVPIVVGRSSRPPIINSDEMIGKYSDRINELKNVKIAYTAITNSNNSNLDAQLESLYRSLKTEIKPVERGSSTWKLIEDYVFKTHGVTHKQTSNLEIVDVYEITREPDKQANILNGIENQPFYREADKNLHLLWHGTRLSNYISILQNGLVLRPELISKAQITGKMFANGIYAANSFSKSLNYCGYNETNNQACLFLGEFLLGRPLEQVQANPNLDEKILLKQGCHSTWGRGKLTPSSYTTMPSVSDATKPVKVPNGNLINSGISSCLQYDEFIVYNEKQLRLRFIVHVLCSKP